MQIGVSARGLTVPVGGARRVLDEVLRYLPAAADGHRVISYQPPGTPAAPGVEPVWVSARHPAWWELAALPRALRRHPSDVLFSPKSLLPPGLPVRMKAVTMILDLLYFPVRGRYLHEYRLHDIAYMRTFLGVSIRRADAVICISENTRRDLIERWPSCADKAVVVPLGVHRPAPEAVDPARVEAVRRRYGIERPYILYTGSLSPRKNMVRGVQAWARLASRFPHDLVVTAGKSWRDEAVEAEVDRCGLRDRFKRLGVVADADLPALYAGAAVFFFPSLYEGFGLPVLEAMACGCPVAASNASSIPEVAGDAARLFDPESVDAMADALERVIGDADEAVRLRHAGLARAGQFSWERSIRAIWDVIRKTGEAA